MYQTLRVRSQDSVRFLQIYRPEAKNTISTQLISEFTAALAECTRDANVVVIEGLPDVFCFGADFQQISSALAAGENCAPDPGPLFDIWQQLVAGPFVSVAHVRGRVNAGGVGFVAACDVVVSDDTAQFSLSELLFGVYPACVLPFLIRRVGLQRAHYMTLMAQPISAQQAQAWGLVDAVESSSETLLLRHLLRLRRLSRVAIHRYKEYLQSIQGNLEVIRPRAIAGNQEVFSDPANLAGIVRFVEKGIFPWES